MVDPDPGYRPRRAAGSGDGPADAGPEQPSDPAAPAGPAAPGSAPASGSGSTPGSGPTSGSTPVSGPGDPAGASPVVPSGTPEAPRAAAGPQPAAGADPDETQPKPLYRDELGGPAAPRAGSAGDAPASGEETRIVRPLNFRQRRPQPADEDATTLLPRTGAGGRRSPRDDDDSDDDGRSRPLLGARGRLALLVSAVAAVVVVGLAVLYAVSTVGDPSAQPSVNAPSGSGTDASAPPTDAPALLGDEALLTPAAAKPIDARSWRVATTERTVTEDTPVPACLSNEPVEGEPTAQQEAVRVLTSSGRDAPTALHQAAAYASPEDAAQAYAVAARTLGGCLSPGAYIAGGAAVTGLGDQAAGLVVNVITDGKTRWHSILVSRTGRVLNIVDAVRSGDTALSNTGVAQALGAVTATQCQAAGGQCAATPALKAAPPPLGGDVPGFLATGDLPPAGKADENWVATPVDQPSQDFLGSQCETVNWTRTGADVAASRVYLVPSSTTFGLNDIVLTMADEKAADALVAKIRGDLRSCSKRQLTASVTEPREVEGAGASGSEVSGWTATVEQKTTEGTQRFRVGIVSSGLKVAYTFLNPLPDGYDLSSGEWDMVAVRAGQRMTQVR